MVQAARAGCLEGFDILTLRRPQRNLWGFKGANYETGRMGYSEVEKTTG